MSVLAPTRLPSPDRSSWYPTESSHPGSSSLSQVSNQLIQHPNGASEMKDPHRIPNSLVDLDYKSNQSTTSSADAEGDDEIPYSSEADAPVSFSLTFFRYQCCIALASRASDIRHLLVLHYVLLFD